MHKRLTWVWVFAGWALFGALTTSQTLLFGFLTGDRTHWGRTVSWIMTGWLLWGLASRPVFEMARRFPFRRDRWPGDLGRHFLLGLGTAMVLLFTEALVNTAIWYLFGEAMQPFDRFLSLLKYKLHVYLLVYGLFVGAVQILGFYQRQQRREREASQLALKAATLETRLADARFQALQNQVQPHFLFNAHHAILGLILQGDTERAAAMLNHLSDLLRMTLDRAESGWSTLAEEVSALKAYLAIQEVRFQDRLQVAFSVPEAVEKVPLPHFLLQPLVENAIRHGIEAKKDAGLVSVSARRDGDTLILTVLDDGPGPPEAQVWQAAKGIGLRNVSDRVARLFGDQASLILSCREQGGCQAEIRLPFETQNWVKGQVAP